MLSKTGTRIKLADKGLQHRHLGQCQLPKLYLQPNEIRSKQASSILLAHLTEYLDMSSALSKEGDMETESGLIIGEEKMEVLIFVEIRKLEDNRQRAKSTKVR